ncbi:MAG: MlaD family protein, partial [Desulfobulbaceae bacterium]|nr:MlaD family protein [Desulfobulbaceae bacterium]
EYQDQFVVEQGNMPKPVLRTGKHYTLVSSDSGSLETGAPVLYKKMVVGEINNIDFGPEAESIQTDILVYDEYTSLVRENSVFWNVSGVEVDASLSHFNINLSSIKSMLAGGIAFTNPEKKSVKKAQRAQERTTFTLFESFSKAAKNIPSLRPRGTILRLLSSADNDFDIGSPVLYKQIPIGEVLDFSLSDDQQNIVFQVLIYEKYTDLINTTTRFYNFSGFTIGADLTGIEVQAGPIATIVSGGISFMTPGRGEAIQDNLTFVLYEDYDAAVHKDSIPVTIFLDKAGGVREKTKIKYQGIEIGAITTVRFTPDMQGIIAEGRVQKMAGNLFRQNTRLWLVKPQFGLSGIRNLETVLTGAYIDIMPGDGELKTDFILLPDIPGTDSYAGLNIVLETPRLGSLGKNSPVYYRQVQVGQVTGFELSPTAQQVWVRVNIHPAYENLVHTGTRFWLASGIRASWGLFSGFDLDSESMETIIAGGIALATPAGEEMGEPAVKGDHFILHEKSEQTWLDWSPVIMLNGETKVTRQAEQPEKHSTIER